MGRLSDRLRGVAAASPSINSARGFKGASVVRIIRATEVFKLKECLSELAEHHNRVIGFCKVNCSRVVGTLEYMVVLNSQRGKGYGAQLMKWAMGKFRETSVAFVEVKVIDGNEAIRFYEKYGFKMNAHLLRLNSQIGI